MNLPLNSNLMHTWVCQDCGYEVEEVEAPESCPSCGAVQESFVMKKDEDE